MKRFIIISIVLFIFGMLDGLIVPWIISTDTLALPLQAGLIILICIPTVWILKLSWRMFVK